MRKQGEVTILENNKNTLNWKQCVESAAYSEQRAQETGYTEIPTVKWGEYDVYKEGEYTCFVNAKHGVEGADQMGEYWDGRPKFHVGVCFDDATTAINTVLDVLVKHDITRFKIMNPDFAERVEKGNVHQYGKLFTIYLGKDVEDAPGKCMRLCSEINLALEQAGIKKSTKLADESDRPDWKIHNSAYVTVAPPRTTGYFSYESSEARFKRFWDVSKRVLPEELGTAVAFAASHAKSQPPTPPHISRG